MSFACSPGADRRPVVRRAAMNAAPWLEAAIGFVVPTAVVVWGVLQVWRWIRPDFKNATRIVPGVVEFALVCVIVILIVLGWEMFKTWRRPRVSPQSQVSASEWPAKSAGRFTWAALPSGPDTIDGVLEALKARHLRPIEFGDVPSLFGREDARRLTSHGAPAVLEWSAPPRPCRLEFMAGPASWGERVAQIDVRCAAAERAEAISLILERVRVLSPRAVENTAEHFQGGSDRLSLDWSGDDAWKGSGATVGAVLEKSEGGWISILSIRYPHPSARDGR
jgi:hypothetical protein